MKRLLTLAAILALAVPGIAQTEPDTTQLQIGTAKVIIIDEDSVDSDWENEDYDPKLELTYWAGLDVGVNLLVNADNSTNLGEANDWMDLDYSRSLSWRLNIFEQKIRLAKDYAGILVGAGLTWNSYSFKNDIRVVSNTEAFKDTTFGVEDTLVEFSKNKLRATYIHVPLMLEFNTSTDPKKNFHVAAGVIGGWKIGSITKQEYNYDGAEYRVRQKADYNLTPLTLDLTARIGYRNFTVFGTYGLTPLFEDGKGPEVYPVTVGISIVPFG